MSERARIAIVGCGAVTELAHLPALRRLGEPPLLIVDPDLQRAGRLARKFGVPRVASEHTAVIGAADAAIVAAPNRLHASISRDLLLAGVHVLFEKPMALTYAECLSMIDAADRAGVVLMVGLRRRFVRTGSWMKRTLDSGVLGAVESFAFRDGSIFNWQVVSDSVWRRESAGGGVLMDIGAHVLDQLLWWLGPVESVEYFDDSFGGVEADCLISLTLRSGARGTVELSRTRELGGSAVVTGTRGTIEVALDGNWAERDVPGLSRIVVFRRESWFKAFDLELENWLAAIAGRAEPATPGTEVAASVELIETCYRVRQPLDLPWLVPA